MLTDKQIKNLSKLAAALRSGKYPQAVRRLRVEDCFCCLGVACDLSQLGEWSGDYYVIKNEENEIVEADYKSLARLPSVLEFYGLCFSLATCQTTSARQPLALCEELAGCNDAGANFVEIADMIDRFIETSAENLGACPRG